MANAEFHFRNQLLEVVGHSLDVLDAVIDEIDLTVAALLAQDGVPDQLLVVFHHIGLNRVAVIRRRFNE
ncbi:hypothetical protein SDC9_171794 [bioreactor metagenome]|uniref:Uncharacterized protein n=1 Tax=bioreactor metagenome TaxID=1076179 RepID=A0A645GE19_9ZZZZ